MSGRLVARTIQTPRLTLRPFVPDDEAAYAAIRAKPEVMRYLSGGEARAATAAADAAVAVASFAAQWDEHGYGPWAVIRRTDARLLGHAGLRKLPDLGGETEILYLLDRDVWGMGLATEAAAGARDFGFATIGLRRLVGFAVPQNLASLRVLQKIGMHDEGEVEVFGLLARRCAMMRPNA